MAIPPPMEDIFDILNPGSSLIMGKAIGTSKSIITAIAVARKFGSEVQVISIVITPRKLIRFILIVFHEELVVVKPLEKMVYISSCK
jgi:hypothetical protein